jgi:ZU5 domain
MNRLRNAVAAIALAAASLFSTSCSDVTAPSSASPSVSALLGLPSGLGGGVSTLVDTTVNALQLSVPLLSDISRSATIGPEGGSISIPETGFRLDVPKNALSAPTLITVTAVQGATAAYEFEPHGIALNKRLVVTQDLGLTSIVSQLFGHSFTGAYFTSRNDLGADGTAAVHELEPTNTDLLQLRVQFSIGHFSGYLVGVD